MKNTKINNSLMYEQIISWDNIVGAYLDLYETFTEKNKSLSYSATDGNLLFDIEIDCENVLKKIQQEIIDQKSIKPAKYIDIPKKNGGTRGIYILPVKERIKCQAIYRVIEPIFEAQYSDYLYSFRTTKTSYYASRSVRRYYLRNYRNPETYVLKIDIHNYSDNHDHKHLLTALNTFGIESDAIDLIKLFIHQSYIKNGMLMARNKGTMQGMNLCPLFNNIYVDHIDKYIGSKVHFYRRVGDDFIIFDNDKKKLQEIDEYVSKEAKRIKLPLNDDKKAFGHISEGFDFLGINYQDGTMSLPLKSYNRIIYKYKTNLRYNQHTPLSIKIHRLKQLLKNSRTERNRRDSDNFMHYIRSYNLITDTAQIQNLSNRFFQLLVNYFTGGYNYKNLKATRRILRQYKFPSLSKLHHLYTTGKSIK